MADRWLEKYNHQYFVTVAKNFQPGAGPDGCNTFDCHDETVLFPDKAMLLAAIPSLTERSRGCPWVVIATQDVGTAIRDAVKGFRSH